MSPSATDPVPSAPAPPEPAAEIDAVLRGLLDRLFVLVATLGTLTLVAATLRVLVAGYNPDYLVDVLTFGVVAGVLALRRRLPSRVVFGVFVGAVVALGVVSLATLGLASAGIPILTAVCILFGVFVRLRTAIIMVLATFVAIVLVGTAHVVGVLPPLPNVAQFITAPSSWATQATSFLAFVVAAVVAAASVRRRLSRSLEELSQRGADLERVAEQLRESEQRHRLLAENMTDVVFVQGLDLGMIYVSKSAEALFGRSVDDLLRVGMVGAMTPESLRRAQEIYGQYLPRARRGEEVAPPLIEFEYVRADGSTFWGELKVKFLRDGKGALAGSQGVLRDISERRRDEAERLALKERLREMDKLHAIGQLAGGVAHDFNNQLAAIMGFAELIAADGDAGPMARSHAHNILLSARRSADLTGKLLTFARRTQQRFVTVDVHVLLAEVVAMLERTVDKHIRIACSLEAPRALIRGDASQLVSAFLNLGLNARDAMPHGGRLVFATQAATDAADRWLEVRVTDTGIGMDAETISHAFEPFFTLKDVGKGTGLGLAAVYGTVQSHGGKIDIQSAPGAGTTFTLRFPLREASTGDVAAQAESMRQPTHHRAAILVVDDEALVGRSSGLALEQAGHRVHVFQSPAAALEHYREHWREIEVVVLDMIMPEMTGEQLFVELQAVNRNVAVLLTSGHVAATTIEHLLEQGAREFLAKPFTHSEMLTAVERVLAAKA